MDYDYDDNNSDRFNLTDFNSTFSGYEQLEDYVIIPLLVLIGIVGLLVNGALIFILYKTNVRSTINVFLLSLSVADVIVIFFYMPFAAFTSFPLGDAMCKLSEGLNDVSAGVTAFSLTALTVYCFFETTPTPQSWTWRTSVVAVAGVWALAVTVAGPTLLLAHVLEEEENGVKMAFCYAFDPRFEPRQGPLRFVMYYAIPLIAFFFFYCIARLSGTLERQTVAQREVSTLTIWLLVVYALCLFLANMSTFWLILPMNDHEFWHILDVTGFYFELFYRCLNPFVLYCVSENFRQLFNRYLLCWCVKGNRLQVADMERNRPLC